MTLRRDAGFTLVELMIVLAIMALMAAIALPRLIARGPATAVSAAAEEVRAALGTARSAAIAEDRTVRVAGGDGFYRIDGAPHALVSAAGVRVEAPRGGIAFFASGGSSGGQIVLRGGGRSAALDIDSLTGRASFAR